MAADIAPELYEKIKEAFERKYAKAQLLGSPISETLKALEEGTATFRDADLYAGEVGSLLSEALKECISLDQMPGGKFYYNIATRTVGQALQDEYRLASNVAGLVQEEMNEALGIGLKAVRPEPDEHRIRNVVDRASRAETQEQLEAALSEPVKTEVRRASDDTQKANARLHNSAGLEVKVEREYDGVGLSGGRECSWCQDRAGTFTYAEAMANGVFERHEGCGCIITYTSAKGRRTVSNSKYGGWEKVEERGKRIAKEQEIMNSLANNGRARSNYMAASRITSISQTQPIKHSGEEIRALEQYAADHGFRIQAPQKFSGDNELLKEQIDVLYSLCQEYGYHKEIVLGFEGMDSETFARASTAGNIFFNSDVLRDRQLVNAILKADNQLSAQDIKGIVAHEFGHLFTNLYGNDSLEIAKEAYYNIYGEMLNKDELLLEIRSKISVYAAAIDENTNKYEELLPEVLGKHVTDQDEFTSEFLRIIKARWLL